MEKLLYIQNGVFHNKSLTAGLQLVDANGTMTTIAPGGTGNYTITYDNGSFAFEPFSQTSSLEKLNTSYFISSSNSPIAVATNGTIPYFIDSDTFGAINLPANNNSKYYVLKNKEFVELETKPSTILGSSSNKGIVYVGNNNNFSYLNTTDEGDYVIKYSSGSYSLALSESAASVKREFYIEGSSLTSGPALVSGTFGSSASSIIQHNLDSNLFVIESGKSYLVSIDIELYCSNYADILNQRNPISFKIRYNVDDDPIVAATLSNPIPYQHVSGTGLINSTGRSFSLAFETNNTGSAGAVNFNITRFKVTIISV